MAELGPALGEGLRLFQAGDAAGAERAFRRALAVEPGVAEGWYLLGRACQALGRPEEAAAAHRRAIALAPALAEAHNNLGVVLKALGQVAEAAGCYREALRLRPDYVEARNNLGNALQREGRLDEAVECFRLALRLRPDYAEAHNNLAIALKGQGRWGEAADALREAIRLRPGFAEAFANLGSALAELGSPDEAMACYDRALGLRPDFEEAAIGRGCVLGRRGRLEEAEALFREAVRTWPGSAEPWGNLGYFLAEQGRVAEGLDCYREAIRLRPDAPATWSNYLYFLNYDPAVGPAELLEEHRRGAAALAGAAPAPRRAAPDEPAPDQGRPLRVGYVSPDFRRHPVAAFLEPILAHHDPGRVEAVCYADVASPDATTERLRGLAHEWRATRFLPDDRLEELIRRDRIDILIDLAGHTARNRLGVFAHRPAPVQVTYLGYPETTGLPAIDALLTDAVVDPPGERARTVEEPLRLPGPFCVYAPPADAPAVSAPPVARAGFATFGSLHKLPKLHAGVLDLWAELLRAVPSARLRLVRDTLKGRSRAEILAHFERQAIDPGRVEAVHEWTLDAHWDAYAPIDVMLDTFPWSGHTTACESLWMGVPIVTLAGERRASRLTASVLAALGLDELIADTAARYVEIAAGLAGDPDRLAGLRASLRERMRNSPLCDGAAFTRHLEAAYEALWRRRGPGAGGG